MAQRTLPILARAALGFSNTSFIKTGSLRCLSTAVKPFPSLKIYADRFTAQGSFAEAQAAYLNPDQEGVADLDAALRAGRTGVVAHFYMDPELQGTLNRLEWPHVFIADSLAMGDAAAKMAQTGEVDAIACLGVDFMSEGVRAVLDHQGFGHLPVYRLDAREIGCSLAESAERAAYRAYLAKAAQTPNSLHVVYINTSLVTKAHAHAAVPTLTCTSSNVVQTVLQAFAQIPELRLWYGPDTYMGQNLYSMFQKIAAMSDEEIARLHPAHNRATVGALLGQFEFFKQGMCVVHHMFGEAVTADVRAHYADSYHTAHLEVPGEMFELALEAQQAGNGVIGSTSNILNFITDKTKEALAGGGGGGRPLSFVLGTEAGMVTSIVQGVQAALRGAGGGGTRGREELGVEIVFPVAAEAVAPSPDGALGVVPGAAGGEGCSTAGGCATCPYMKMNSLDALQDLAQGVVDGKNLEAYLPQRHTQLVQGKSIMELGAQPIIHMRSFMQNGVLSDELVNDIRTRNV